MDNKFVNVIYLDKDSNRFAFIFIMLFLLVPNIVLIICMFALYGKDFLRDSSVLLPVGIYTIINAMMIIMSFFGMENNKEKYIRILDEGLVYNSLLKKFAVPWINVTRVRVNPYVTTRPTILVYTTKGSFYFTGMFVNAAEEIPQIKPGFFKPKFYFPSGGEFDGNMAKNELYLLLKEKIPDKFF
jgi:hypothetical protein